MSEYRLTEQIGYILRKANQRHTALFGEAFSSFPLTPRQFAVLFTVGGEGETSQNQLGRLTAMDPATVQGVVRRLAARNLVIARDDPTDGRRSLWRISRKGRQLLERVMPAARKVTERTLAPLSKQEGKRLLALLEKIT